MYHTAADPFEIRVADLADQGQSRARSGLDLYHRKLPYGAVFTITLPHGVENVYIKSRHFKG